MCKFNRYRSNIALALFNKYNKNRYLEARASGIIQGPKISKKQKKIANEFGVNLKNKPKPLTEANYNWANLVIILGDDIPKELFDNIEGTHRKVIVWKLKDVMQFDNNYHKKTKLLSAEIEKRIKNLVRGLR